VRWPLTQELVLTEGCPALTFEQWITLLASVTAFLTALATLLTIREMKRQRKSAYKPDLLLRPTSFRVSPNDLPNQRPVIVTTGTASQGRSRTSILLQLYNAGFGPAKYIEVNWQFDCADFVRHLAGLPGPAGITVDNHKKGFLNITFDGERPARIFHNLATQRSTSINILPPQAEESLVVPPAYTDLLAGYVLTLSRSLSNQLQPDALSLPQFLVTVRYKDLEGDQHVKTFNVVPGLVAIRSYTPAIVDTDSLADGFVKIHET